MFMIRQSSLFLTALIWVTSCQAFGENILINPGFESGVLFPWYQDRDLSLLPKEPWNVTNLVSQSGLYSVTDVGNLELRQNFTAVPVSQITEVSFWLKHPDGDTRPFSYYFFYSDFTWNRAMVFSADDAFAFFDVTSELNPGKSLVGVSVWGYSSSSDATDRTYVDDFTIERVPEPVSVSALGSCIALVALIWRRRGR
jgi:hypothetical protein